MASDLLSLSLDTICHSIYDAWKKSPVPSPELIYPLVQILLKTDSTLNQARCIAILGSLCGNNERNRELVCQNKFILPLLLSLLARERKNNDSTVQKLILFLIWVLCENHSRSEMVKNLVANNWDLFSDISHSSGVELPRNMVIFILELVIQKEDRFHQIFEEWSFTIIPFLVDKLQHHHQQPPVVIEKILVIFSYCFKIEELSLIIVKEILEQNGRHPSFAFSLSRLLLKKFEEKQVACAVVKLLEKKISCYLGVPPSYEELMRRQR